MRYKPPWMKRVSWALVAVVACGPWSDAPLLPQPATAQSGSYVVARTWRGAGGDLPPGSFREASGVALAPDGRVFVSDAAEGRISVVQPDETVRVLVPRTDAAGGPRAPGHLAVDADRDRLYVADSGARRVLVFDLDGRPLDAWDVGGQPAGLAVAPDATVVVADADGGRVLRFHPNGHLLASWPATEPEPGGDLLRGLDVDGDGRVHVLLGRAPQLAVFHADGTRTGVVRINPPGLAVRATDVDVDADPRGVGPDLVWVTGSRGLLLYEPARGVWSVNPLGADLTAVASDRARGVHVTFVGAPPAGGRLLRLPHASAAVSGAGRSWSGSLLVPGTLAGPVSLAVADDGHAVVIDRWPRVQRFAPDGSNLGQVAGLDAAAAAADAQGALFVTDGGLLQAFAPADWRSGRPAAQWALPVAPGAADANTVALAVDPLRGGVLALDAAGAAVRHFSAAGARGTELPLGGLTLGATIWADMAVAADGTVYVLDRGLDAVHALSPGGPPRTVRLNGRARRLAVGPGGPIFTLQRDGWVRRLDGAGTVSAAFDATRFDLAPASSPSDLGVTAAGEVLVADRAADAITVFRWDDAAAPAEPPERGAQCRYYPAKAASPAELMLGQELEVRLTVRGGCGSEPAAEPLDILLVLDRSGSMAGERLRLAKSAALGFVAEVDMSVTRIGVVSFHDSARLEVGLTADSARVRRAIAGLEAEGGTRVHAGLAEARAELGRRGRREARPVFVVLSDGGSDLEDARREAALARERGVEIFAVGIQAWDALMRAVADDDEHYFRADSARFLFDIFGRIAERVTTSILFRAVEVTDRLPANMAYVAGSAEPAAAWDAASRTLRWSLTDVPFTGFALRYAVVPTHAGRWPVNEAAWADFQDGFGAAGRLDFPVPDVTVRTTATPTAAASVTPTATDTTAPTVAPDVTPRPTAAPEPIFLPLALRESCAPGRKHADVMLVLDTSSSMAGAKLAAAVRAAAHFGELLRLPDDRVGVVSFDSAARLELPLTGDPARLREAIDRLRTSPGTRIDLGLAAALAELEAAERDALRTAVIVLLTDGRQDDTSGVLAQAERARRAQIVVFTVGLGDDVDASLLTRVAGSASQSYLAPTAADLEGIYERIAVLVPCPPESFWGRR